MGATATGAVDPLPRILELQAEYGFRVHCDAAYGGYFVLADNLDAPASAGYRAMIHADSIAIDPHKHGLQPYGCGCVLFRDPSVGTLYKHDSPYTYFSSAELHLGEITLECSRAGASAVALWATQRLLPLVKGGEFVHGLESCRSAAIDLYSRICADDRFLAGPRPELDIVVWAPADDTASAISRRSRLVFEAASRQNLHLALANLPATLFEGRWPAEFDQPTVTCLRSCTLKPEHADWMDRIWAVLSESVGSEK
jgi:glutamate/tyrosine decarboxylase-like PLP-dependent enzyme